MIFFSEDSDWVSFGFSKRRSRAQGDPQSGEHGMVVVVVLVVVGESVDVGVDVAACSNSPPHGLVAKHFDPPSSHWQHPAW